MVSVDAVTDEAARLRRELERLRTENHRLFRLLELRGQNTTPAPEQLAACARVAHVDALASLLAARGHQALLLQGGMTAADRRAAVDRLAEAKAGDGILVIGTTPFIGEGFDAPVLDTLFLAGPISFDGLLIQCAGRVIRAAPGKDIAEVHDYHDPTTPILAVSLQRRMPGYRALGFIQP